MLSDPYFIKMAQWTRWFHIWLPVIGVPVTIFAGAVLLLSNSYTYMNLFWMYLFAYSMIEGLGHYKVNLIFDLIESI